MDQADIATSSDALPDGNAEPRKRLFVLQWSLGTLLLLTAAVAVWVAYFHLRREIPRLEQRVASMQGMARELVIEDSEQIAVVKLPEMWYDENRWDVHLPEGEYVMRLATRQIDEEGSAPAVGETLLGAGRHRIELVQSDEGDGRRITVVVDAQPSIEVAEGAGWNPGHGSTGGSLFGRSAQSSPDEPLVLFRRRFSRRLKSGRTDTPKGPTEGLLLWIERVEPTRGER